MNRTKTRVTAIGGLLAAGLVMTPFFAANADQTPPGAVAHESSSLAADEQTQAPASASALGLASGEKLTVKAVIEDEDGGTHVRYHRTLDGLRVIGGDLVAHKDAKGAVEQVTYNRGYKNITPASRTAKVSKAAAQAKGLATAQATKGETSAGSELVVLVTDQGPKLAYDVLTTGVRANQVPTRLHTYVDAGTGAVLLTDDEIKTGTGDGIFVGNVTINTTPKSGGGFEMRDAVGHTATDVHNQGNPNTGEGPVGDIFTDADDKWGTGAQSDRASAAVDALYGAQKTFDYYKTQLGRNGIWNDGRGARSRVHFANAMVNAFWDGTQMSYGDGANNAAPLTELDVAAHEMSHGVTENTAGLVYSGEAGGLNEATSDIFGAAVEFYVNNPNDVPDYFIGEEINIHGNGTPLRYMDKPSKDGVSKDCWSSTLGSLDPHYSSGPLNHWYFMLSEGSGAKTINGISYNSPTCSGAAAVTGIGRAKAEKIWYRTLATYLTSSSKYSNARTGAIKSAKDLYGQGSAECLAVEKAFTAIAVAATTETCGTGNPNPSSPTVTNPGAQTSTAGTADTLQLAAAGGTTPYSWSATGLPAGLTVNASTGLISGTPTAAATSTVTATVTDAAGKTAGVSFSWVVSGASGTTCTGALTYNGSLIAGTSKTFPAFSDSDAGRLKVCLDGPTGSDFDVYLQKRSGLSWVTVAQGTSPNPDESFSYTNTAGTYRLLVKADSGSGAFKASVSE
ncbi:M4 family metallopeptidase [Kribbella sp. CA-293567]|uniref:M4 family metallopeptidase n=1 Tax=Kribbella sp. CA-293567 TaxID=3002436 RepID=UPI0022DD4973|nr:M4 family metallopeptidase [Kribbella sp. CA-293567]WBQ03070.1 M4 family metallopeptidase [Kribbella sp. CA-293567]